MEIVSTNQNVELSVDDKNKLYSLPSVKALNLKYFLDDYFNDQKPSMKFIHGFMLNFIGKNAGIPGYTVSIQYIETQKTPRLNRLVIKEDATNHMILNVKFGFGEINSTFEESFNKVFYLLSKRY